MNIQNQIMINILLERDKTLENRIEDILEKYLFLEVHRILLILKKANKNMIIKIKETIIRKLVILEGNQTVDIIFLRHLIEIKPKIMIIINILLKIEDRQED